MEEESFFEMPQFKCLESLVGISQKECPCFPEVSDEKMALIRTSQTGLFVDEHDGASGLIQLGKATCGDGDVWEQMINARKEAVLKVILDVSVNLNQKFTTIPKYKHEIGETKYSSLSQSTTTAKSLIIKTLPKIGALMKISGFGLIAKVVSGNPLEVIRITIKNKTAVLEITKKYPLLLVGIQDSQININFLKDRIDDLELSASERALLESQIAKVIIRIFDFDVKPNSWGQPNNTIHDVDPFSVPCDGSEYEISYNTGGVIIPYQNSMFCNCEGIRRSFAKYIEVKSGEANGLTVMCEFLCNENYLLCQIANSNITLRMLVSDAIRVLTIYKFLNKEKTRSKQGTTVNNVLNIKNFDETLGMFNGEYTNLMTDIIEKMTGLNSEMGCFTCNQTFIRTKTEGVVLTEGNPMLVHNELSGTYEYASDNYSQLVKSRESMPVPMRHIFNI